MFLQIRSKKFYLINVINRLKFLFELSKFKSKKINYIIADEQISIRDIVGFILNTIFFLNCKLFK